MGMGGGSTKSGALKSDINVAPLVDIVLVLLIIFLITMPVLMRQITLEVPRQLEDHEDITLASKQITAIVHLDGTVSLQEGASTEEINRTDLARVIRQKLERKKGEKVVFVDFDDALAYDEVITAMDTIKGAGAEKVALKTRDKPPGQ